MRALSDCIKEIRNDHSIATWNEAQAREWIILPILDLLGWGRREIIPEYKVVPGKIDSDKVDYALQINGDDKVFIEAKRPQENLENHQEQLLGYSFKKGIKLAILTNGIEWWFYLPLKEGDWDDRKFYTFDILEQEIEDIIDKFGRFLSRENVVSGEAVQQAESILKNRQKEKAIRESLPEAWNSVIKEPHELLVEILIETVEEVCDFKPENIEVLRFIRSKQENWLLSSESEQKVPTTNRPNTKTSCQTKNQTEKSKWMQIDGDNYDLRYKYEILVNTANWLIDKGDLKPSDCPIKKVQGKSDLINKTGNNLEDARKLKNGLYIDTHGIIKKTVIPYAKRLLKKYGYDPEILQIDY